MMEGDKSDGLGSGRSRGGGKYHQFYYVMIESDKSGYLGSGTSLGGGEWY
jgi:hypothetical protein